jgi:hydroxymethylpyrimidine/phosphomethylpyrimidine kinase
MRGRVLIIAGSDSGGGAGIQADIKTVTALGGFAASAVTVLTAQNTRGVFGVLPVPPEFIRQQIEVVLDDIGADCIKLGMLHDVATIEVVADALETRAEDIPLVADPVMIAKGGASLLLPEAVDCLRQRILPLATLLTPNLPEACALAGMSIHNSDDQVVVAQSLRHLGSDTVLLKGGRATDDPVVDVLASADGAVVMESPRLDTRSVHGAGCTLASAIATGLAQGLPLGHAVARGRRFLFEAIRSAPPLGSGFGPLNHAHTVRAFGLSGDSSIAPTD